MASVKKFQKAAVLQLLRHVDREVQNPSNKGIDPERTPLNYALSPIRSVSTYDYYKTRLAELYVFNRADIVVLAGWVVTAPADLPAEQEDLFFQTAYDFLADRYGEKNVVTSVVHKDEPGQPHLHFLFIPAIPDAKHGGERYVPPLFSPVRSCEASTPLCRCISTSTASTPTSPAALPQRWAGTAP